MQERPTVQVAGLFKVHFLQLPRQTCAENGRPIAEIGSRIAEVRVSFYELQLEPQGMCRRNKVFGVPVTGVWPFIHNFNQSLSGSLVIIASRIWIGMELQTCVGHMANLRGPKPRTAFISVLQLP